MGKESDGRTEEGLNTRPTVSAEGVGGQGRGDADAEDSRGSLLMGGYLPRLDESGYSWLGAALRTDRKRLGDTREPDYEDEPAVGSPDPIPPAAGTEEVGDGSFLQVEDELSVWGKVQLGSQGYNQPQGGDESGSDDLGVPRGGALPGGPDAAPILGAIQRYFPASEWERAACVAWRESRYKAGEVSDTDDHGIFQLHQYADLERDGWAGWRPYFEALGWGWSPYDIDWNVRAAAHIWERNGWAAWTTHNDGGC